MEADERMVPDPDDFWDRAMDLVGEMKSASAGLMWPGSTEETRSVQAAWARGCSAAVT
jgi:hypothetical protein